MELTYILHPVEFDLLDATVREITKTKVHSTFMKQREKLNKLVTTKSAKSSKTITNRVSKKNKFYQRTVNLTPVHFGDKEIKLLGQGLKYAPTLKLSKNDWENFCVDIDVALAKDKTGMKYAMNNLIKNNFTNNYDDFEQDKEDRTIKKIRQKIKEHNLIITKADKGNTTVIIKEEEYDKKINEFINENEIVEITNPTTKFQIEVKDIISQSSNLFRHEDKQKLLSMNPSAPPLFGLPKLHKENIPIRPVVSYRCAPAYKLAQDANTLFKECTNFIPKYAVKNSADLINQIKDIRIPVNAKLVSFDVKNLFTNVPVEECLDEVKNILTEFNVNPYIASDLERVIKCCVNQNYFKYKDKFYKQKKGLAMGSPLSPLLADIYMTKIEKLIFRDKDKTSNILYWKRYVDDILCIWTGTSRQLDKFFKYLNLICTSIKFTREIGLNNSINFLDLNIEIIEGQHKFGIFRKETFCDNIIPVNSRHPWNQKLSAFHAMVHRLLEIPMEENNFIKELNTITEIATNNGYESNVVTKILKNKRKKRILKMLYPQQNEESNDKNWRRIPYIGNISMKVGNELRKLNIEPAYYCNKNLGALLRSKKGFYDKEKLNGIYKIKCHECSATYVGQTGRSFATRIKEHHTRSTSSFFKHLSEEQHAHNEENWEILHVINKGRKMDALETLEINRLFKSNTITLNDHPVLNSPLLQPW